MGRRAAKFCTDLDKIRWSLLKGVINRKSPQDGPTEGKEVSIEQVTAVEQRTVERVRRSPLGWPVSLAGTALLLTGWGVVWALGWAAAIPLFLAGGAGIVWGARRIPGRTEVLEAHQIVIPGARPEDWLVVGSMPEAMGFVEGVKAELRERENRGKETPQTVGPQ